MGKMGKGSGKGSSKPSSKRDKDAMFSSMKKAAADMRSDRKIRKGK